MILPFEVHKEITKHIGSKTRILKDERIDSKSPFIYTIFKRYRSCANGIILCAILCYDHKHIIYAII